MCELTPREGYGGYDSVALEIVPRKVWGAEDPLEEGKPLGMRVEAIVGTLNTDTETCATPEDCQRIVRSIQKRQMEEGSADIQYNFLIGCDGRVYEGRGWNRKSCPRLPRPEILPEYEDRLDIAFLGDWRYVENPTIEMLDPFGFLVMYGIQKEYISPRYRYFDLDKRYVRTGKTRKEEMEEAMGFSK